MKENILTYLVWFGLFWSGFMVIGRNLSNLHQRRDGVYTTVPKFPHVWFALFLLCLTTLLMWYNL